MYDVLTLALAVVVFFGPLISTISFGVRGYQQAQQRNAHPMPFILFYSLLGLIVGGVFTTIILILAEGTIGSRNFSLKEKICSYYTGNNNAGSNDPCSKYRTSSTRQP